MTRRPLPPRAKKALSAGKSSVRYVAMGTKAGATPVPGLVRKLRSMSDTAAATVGAVLLITVSMIGPYFVDHAYQAIALLAIVLGAAGAIIDSKRSADVARDNEPVVSEAAEPQSKPPPPGEPPPPRQPELGLAGTIRSSVLYARVPGLRAAVAEQGEDSLTLLGPIDRTEPPDRPGITATLQLPGGITAAEVIERAEQVETSFDRPPGCVYLACPPGVHPGRLQVFVADQPMPAESPDWGTITDGYRVIDPYHLGVDSRGRQVWLPTLTEIQALFTGVSNTGKSTAMLHLGAAWAIDKTAELQTYSGKPSADFDDLEEASSRFSVGDPATVATELNDALIEAIADGVARGHRLREARAEGRTQAKRVQDDPEVMYDLELDLHPVCFLIDELRELLAAGPPELAANLSTLMRVYGGVGYSTIQGTQGSSRSSIPGELSGAYKLKVCLAVNSPDIVNGCLGAGAVGRGLTAHRIPPGDRGRACYVTPDGQEGEIRLAMASPATMQRMLAMATRPPAEVGHRPQVATGDQVDLASLLDDVANEVAASEPQVYVGDLASRLSARWPARWAGLTVADLNGHLGRAGVVTNPQTRIKQADGTWGNRLGVLRADLLSAHRRLVGPVRAVDEAS